MAAPGRRSPSNRATHPCCELPAVQLWESCVAQPHSPPAAFETGVFPPSISSTTHCPVPQGDILLNGHPKEPGTWRRVAAYVEQMDILHTTATVWETLLLSVHLRLPASVTYEQVER